MMKLRTAVAALAIVCSSLIALGADTEKTFTDVANKVRGTVVGVMCTIKSENGDMPLRGQAICIDASGTFISNALADFTLDPKSISDLMILLPGPEGKTIKAKFLGSDAVYGLSYIQAEEKGNFTAVEFTDAKPAVGQQVVSVGIMGGDGNHSPYFGTAFVSAVLRVPGPLALVTGGRLTNVCSPVFNTEGKCIGIVLRQLALTYQSEAFRQPLPLRGQEESLFFTPVEEFAKGLKKENIPNTVRRPPWLGIQNYSALSEENAKLQKIDLPAIIIENVIAKQPAAEALLKDGDMITAINGKKLEKLANPDPNLTVQNFQRELLQHNIGEVVTFTVISPNQPAHDVKVTIGEMPKTPAEALQVSDQTLGLMLRERVPLDEWLKKGIPATQEGLIVVAVGKDKPADIAGVKMDELITRVNDKPVKNRADYKAVIEEATKAKQPIKLTIMRENQPVQVAVPLQYK